MKKSQSKKAPKFYQIVQSTHQWNHIDRRNDDNFFPAMPQPTAQSSSIGNTDSRLINGNTGASASSSRSSSNSSSSSSNLSVLLRRVTQKNPNDHAKNSKKHKRTRFSSDESSSSPKSSESSLSPTHAQQYTQHKDRKKKKKKRKFADPDELLRRKYEEMRKGRSNRIPLLIPETQLVLPQFSAEYATLIDANFAQQQAGNGDGSLEFIRSDVEHGFGWRMEAGTLVSVVEWLTRTQPRPYQVSAYLEALLQDLIVVLPTGTGKTLIAAMLMHKLKILNPEYMVLFIVDRVPLVFQQAHYIEKQTGLRVSRICGENRTLQKMKFLNDGKYDVLVITAGAFLEVIANNQLDIARQFCCIVFDECHHAAKGHVYATLLRKLHALSVGKKNNVPRVIGLTASPVAASTRTSAENRLIELRSTFNNAAVFCPDVPDNCTNVNWILVTRQMSQENFARRVISHLKSLVDFVNRAVSGQNSSNGNRSADLIDIVRDGCDSDLDLFLSPAVLGRVRGMVESIRFYVIEGGGSQDDGGENAAGGVGGLLCGNNGSGSSSSSQRSVSNDALKYELVMHLDSIKMLLAALEASKVMGVSFGRNILQQLIIGAEESFATKSEHHDQFCTKLKAEEDTIGTGSMDVSQRLERLVAELRREIGSSAKKNGKRTLCIVHTRQVARQLTAYLVNLNTIFARSEH